jgi:hypothetical protein
VSIVLVMEQQGDEGSLVLFQQFDSVLQQVVVEVLVYGQQEVQGDFLGVEHLLHPQGKFVNISVLELALQQGAGVEARHKVLGAVGALPLLPRDNLLCLVVHVVGRGWLHLAVLEEEGAEHGDWPQIEVIDLVVIVQLIKAELGFSDCPSSYVHNEVVVDDSFLVYGLTLRLVAHADQQELSPPGLPQGSDRHLDLVEPIGFSDRVADVVVLVGPLGVVPQVECLYLDFLVVARTEPGHHRVVVGLAGDVFVRPFVVLRFISGHWLRTQGV